MAVRVKKLLRAGGGGENGNGHHQEERQQEQREDQPAQGRGGGSAADGDGGWRTGIRKRIGRGRSRSVGRRREQQRQVKSALSATDDSAIADPQAADAADAVTNVPPSSSLVPGRSVKFADEGSVEMPLTTTKVIQNGAGSPDRSVSSTASASASASSASTAPSAGTSRRRQPAPGEGYIGAPPSSTAEAQLYWRRVLIMLLSPKHTQYEVVAIFYDVRVRAGLSEVTREASRAATSARFANRRYRALTRAVGAEAGVEMISALSLTEYDVHPDEVLVAIPRGYTGGQVAPMAASLLSNDRVQKLMNRIVKRSKPEPTSTTYASSMYGKARHVFNKSKRRFKRRMRKASSGAKVLCSFITVVVLLAWLYYFASPYLPKEMREMIEAGVGSAESLGHLLSGRLAGSTVDNESSTVRAVASKILGWGL
mmetsp:Transcript_17088/g.37250  ORF Transcript_17088/g.37250 Transcript_17088/m.37250 type:complete len:426 (+) Transcript_17088:279-1556(+)